MFDRERVPFDSDAEVDKTKRLVLLGVGVMAAVFVMVAVVSFMGFGAPATFAIQQKEPSAEVQQGVAEQPSECVVVHVLGCVKEPGVYEVAADARIADAVERAGGMTPEASQEAVNLAAKVADGSQVVIPSKDEYEASRKGASGELSEAPELAAPVQGASDKVNINTASADQLQTLNGVGKATAAKIISYREKNGPFKSIDELTNVSGIGEKRLESLRPLIAV